MCVGLDDDFMVIQWDLNCNLIGVHAAFVVIYDNAMSFRMNIIGFLVFSWNYCIGFDGNFVEDFHFYGIFPQGINCNL